MEISSFAARNERPDTGMTVIDWVLWYMLRDIYNEYAAGVLTKEDGAKRKQDALNIWIHEWEVHQRDAATVNRMAELWKSVEEAASMYRKDRSLKNADLVMAVIYGMSMRKNQTEKNNDMASADRCDSEVVIKWLTQTSGNM